MARKSTSSSTFSTNPVETAESDFGAVTAVSTAPKKNSRATKKADAAPAAKRALKTVGPRASAKPTVLEPEVDSTATPRQNIKLTQVAYEKILKAIIYGWLDLGEPLSENDLARSLGLSKAPIRESLGELRLKGLVVVVPQSGSYVFSPTAEQIGELCDFRSLLETRALRASMQRNSKALLSDLRGIVRRMKEAYRLGNVFDSKCLDTEFHHAIIRHSENRYLVQSYERIGHTIDALRHRFMDTAIFRNKAFDEHQKIIALLGENQLAKAADVLQQHIARTKHFQTRVTWTVGTGRLRRKDYKFRDYAAIFQ